MFTARQRADFGAFAPMRVLIVKTSSMGDVIHTLPALSDAVSMLHDVTFDWVVEETFAEIPQWHSAVRAVFPVAIRRWRKSVFSDNHWRELRMVIGLIRSRHYDYIIDAQGLIKSAILTRLAHGQRCGLDSSSCRESLAALAYQQHYRINKNLHAIERIRQLFELSLNFKRPDDQLNYDLPQLQWSGSNNADRSLVFIHSASRPEKLWPVQQWIDLALKAKCNGYRVVLLWGNEAEQQRAFVIADKVDCCEVLPRLNLRSIAELFQRSSAVVGVDTGLSHLAAAIGVPAVTLYFQTSPDLVGTRGQRQSCITATQDRNGKLSKSGISVDQVWEKIICSDVSWNASY